MVEVRLLRLLHAAAAAAWHAAAAADAIAAVRSTVNGSTVNSHTVVSLLSPVTTTGSICQVSTSQTWALQNQGDRSHCRPTVGGHPSTADTHHRGLAHATSETCAFAALLMYSTRRRRCCADTVAMSLST